MPPQNQQQQNKRIPDGAAKLMLWYAGAWDIVQFFAGLTGIGEIFIWVTDIFVEFTLWIWLKRYKVSFSGTRGLIFIGLGVLKLFPLINEFPLWILDVGAVLIMVRLEDKSTIAKVTQGVTTGVNMGAALAKNKYTGRMMSTNVRQNIIKAQQQIQQRTNPTQNLIANQPHNIISPKPRDNESEQSHNKASQPEDQSEKMAA